jgi:hypothetical protein
MMPPRVTPPRVTTPPSPVELAHVEALLERTLALATDTFVVAERCGLTEAAERVGWARDFLYDAMRCVTGTTTPRSD